MLNMEKSSCEGLFRLAGSSQVSYEVMYFGQKADCGKAKTVTGKLNITLLVAFSDEFLSAGFQR